MRHDLKWAQVRTENILKKEKQSVQLSFFMLMVLRLMILKFIYL